MTTNFNDSSQPDGEYNSPQASAPTTNCVHCNAPLLPDARVCLNCGFPVPTLAPDTSAVTTNCIYCNAPLVPDARFCRYCGLPTSTGAPISSAVNPSFQGDREGSPYNPYAQPATPQIPTPNPQYFGQPPSTGIPTAAPLTMSSSPLAPTRSRAWRWGLIVVGLLLAIAGSILIFTASTTSTPAPVQQSTVTYKTIRGSIQSFVFVTKLNPTGGGQAQSTNYIAVDSTGNFYYFNVADLTPALDSQALAQGTQLSLIYRPDVTVDMNMILAPFNERVIGTGIGYKLVQLTVFDTNGQNPKVYNSKEYSEYLQAQQSPVATTTLNKQRLGIGIAGLVAGILIALTALIAPMFVGARRKKQQAALQVGPSPVEGEVQPDSPLDAINRVSTADAAAVQLAEVQPVSDTSSPAVEARPPEAASTGTEVVSEVEPESN